MIGTDLTADINLFYIDKIAKDNNVSVQQAVDIFLEVKNISEFHLKANKSELKS